MSRTVSVQTEINIHQAVRAICEFAQGSFGDTDGWLTEAEAIALAAAAEVILQNVTRKKQPIVCDRCGKPVKPCTDLDPPAEWCHEPPFSFHTCGDFPRVNGSYLVNPQEPAQ